MIFVTVGSQKFPFNRLLKKIDQMAETCIVTDEIVVQTGRNGYVPRFCRCQPFFDKEEFEILLDTCRILITHGGAATMIDAVKRRKKTVVVPRLAKYGEHVDDHQLELLGQLHKMNLVYACPDIEKLPEALREVEFRQFGEYPSNTQAFIASVDDFIRSL